MTGAPQPLDTKYTCIEMDLQTLTGYFNAAICGHEKIAPLKRLWEQQLGIIRTSHSSTTTSAEVLDQIEKIISDRIQELKYPKSHNCVREALLGENQALWAQIKKLRQQQAERERP